MRSGLVGGCIEVGEVGAQIDDFVGIGVDVVDGEGGVTGRGRHAGTDDGDGDDVVGVSRGVIGVEDFELGAVTVPEEIERDRALVAAQSTQFDRDSSDSQNGRTVR